MTIFKKTTILICITVIACALTAFTSNKGLTLNEVFGKVSKIERFEVLDFQGGDMGFPDNLGKGTMAIHPNASPRDKIISLLSQLPPETLVYDNTDEKGRFDRIFVENGTSLMYVHVGLSTGDTVVILFKDGNKDNISDFVNRINQELKEHND